TRGRSTCCRCSSSPEPPAKTARRCRTTARTWACGCPRTTSADVTSLSLAKVDWERVQVELDAQGNAVLERLVEPAGCEELSALYGRDELFRKQIVMARHGYGRGEYKYFNYPLPERVAELRTNL